MRRFEDVNVDKKGKPHRFGKGKMTSREIGTRNIDYYCGLIFEELLNGPVSQSDLISKLRKQQITSNEVQTCLTTMETNGSIEKSKRGKGSEPVWQLVSELQSLDCKEDAEPSENSLNDLCERLDNSSINSSTTTEETTTPKSSISLPPPAVRVKSRGDKSVRNEQTSPKTLPPQSGEHSFQSSLSSSIVDENEMSQSIESSQSFTESLSDRGSFSSSASSSQGYMYTQTTRQENSESVRIKQNYISQTQTGPNTQTISTGQLQIETNAPVNTYQQSEIDPKLRPTVEDLKRIIEVFDNSSDLKPKDVARIAKMGESKKSVNKFLYKLKIKGILTVKTGENNTDPRWNKCSTARYTEQDLKELAAEIVYNTKTPADTASVHHHHHHAHHHKTFVQVGNNNQMELQRSQSEQMRENEVERPTEGLVDNMQNHPS